MYSFAKPNPPKKKRFVDIWEYLDIYINMFFEGVFRVVYVCIALAILFSLGMMLFTGTDLLVGMIWPNH